MPSRNGEFLQRTNPLSSRRVSRWRHNAHKENRYKLKYPQLRFKEKSVKILIILRYQSYWISGKTNICSIIKQCKVWATKLEKLWKIFQKSVGVCFKAAVFGKQTQKRKHDDSKTRKVTRKLIYWKIHKTRHWSHNDFLKLYFDDSCQQCLGQSTLQQVSFSSRQ